MKAHRKLTERGMLYAQIQDSTEKEYALRIKKKNLKLLRNIKPCLFFSTELASCIFIIGVRV